MSVDDRTDIEKIFGSAQHRDWLMSALKLHGIDEVWVEFSGAGDSGSIESVSCSDKNQASVNINGVTILWPEQKEYWDKENGGFKQSDGSDITQPLEKVLEQITYEALEVSGLDWYNNDGGQGHFSIKFNAGVPEINLDIGINYVQTEDHQFNFSEEDEEVEDAPTSP